MDQEDQNQVVTQEEEVEEEEEEESEQEDNIGNNNTGNQRTTGEDEDDEDEDEDEEVEDEDARTFLEFTGSSDKDLARRYLTATEGNLEEAVNLFLTGAPPPVVAPGSPNRQNSVNLLAHLHAFANSARNASGDGDDDEQQLHMDALLSDLTEQDGSLGALARSLMVGSGYSELARVATQAFQQPSTPSETTDEDSFEIDTITLPEAKNRLDYVSKGQSDSVCLVGAHVLLDVKIFSVYMEAGLIPSLCSALNRIGTESSIRVLQVFEAVCLLLCRGLNDAERFTIGWFVPPRRQGSSHRRGKSKATVMEMFRDEIAPEGDLPTLRRLWRRHEIEPSFKNSDENGLLAIATSVRAPVQFLQFLISDWGLNPNAQSSGTLGSPTTVLATMEHVASEKQEVDPYCTEVAQLFRNCVVPDLDDKKIEEKRLASFPIPLVDSVSNELCSDEHWYQMTNTLLRFVSKSSNISSVHRALEILILILEESPSSAPAKHSAWSSLISSALSNECRDHVVAISALRFLKALTRAEGTDQALIDLCRSGTIHRLCKKVWENENDTASAKSIHEAISKRIEGKCDLDGRPLFLLDAARALTEKSRNAVQLLAAALSDMTPFEFEQTKLAESATAYFADENVPPATLLQPIIEQSRSITSPKQHRHRDSTSSAEDVTETSGSEDFQFSFGNMGLSRSRRSTASKGGEHWKSDENKSTKHTIQEKLVESAQSILSESVPNSFPQIVHDFPGKEESVRALLNALPIRLSPVSEHGNGSYVSEFTMHALPLTPKKELERQVLRCGLINDSQYVEFCKRLVGKKISVVHSNELFLCTGYDAKFGAHRLKSLNSNHQHWRIMCASKYTVLERVFDCDDSTEIGSFDTTGKKRILFKFAVQPDICKKIDIDVPSEGAFQSAEGDNSASENKKSTQATSTSALISAGSPVAVWWEGSDELRAGWRLGIMSTELKEGEDDAKVKVTFPCLGLLYDDEIRPSSLVKLISTEELPVELSPHIGDVVRVTSIQGNLVSTNGFGGHTCNISLLTKVRDVEEDSISKRPSIGDQVGILTNDGTSFDTGLIADDDQSKIPYTVILKNGETKKFKENEVYQLTEMTAIPEETVSTKRILSISTISRINQEHCFAVYIRPGSVASEVPDFSQTGNSRLRVFSTNSSHDPESAWSDAASDDDKSSLDVKESSRLPLGARIEGRFAGKSRWYKGHISRVNADGTYDVAYDDGDTERSVPPSYVALASPETEGDQSTGPSTSPVFSLDFRKTFPTQAGRALFDALRREDTVLKTEYNFVTRGFEHQPNFYATFAHTLEHFGAGVFAQFQTYQQAEVLYLRVSKYAKESGGTDRVFIRYEPDRRAPPTVIREILSAFLKAELQKSAASSSTQTNPPKPGARALLHLGPEAKTPALIEALKTSAWVPATIVSTYSENGTAAVTTDDGLFFRAVPSDQLKEAPTRVATAASYTNSVQTPNTRRLSFRSSMMSSNRTPPQPQPPSRLDTPIELTRQFSVFGSTNALRHISVNEKVLSSSPSSTTNTNPAGVRAEDQPPKIQVLFDFNVENKAVPLIDEEEGEDMCVFRLIFESLYNEKKNLSKSNVLRVKWSFLSGLKLNWKIKVLFGESQQGVNTPLSDGGERLNENGKDAFNLLTTLYRKNNVSSNIEWVNHTLSNHFRTQLKDPLGVATRVLPRWMQTIPTKASFLFSERDRVAYLRSSTLGVSRSVSWLQEEVTGYQAKKKELAQLTVEVAQFFNQAEPNDAKFKRLIQMCDKLEDDIKTIKETRFIGQLRQDLVKVDGNHLLRDAMSLMEQHTGERSELSVQFMGDTGAGVGVTHEFYGAVAAELQKVKTNRDCQMWADPYGSKSSDDADLIRPLGLFPHPLFPAKNNKKATEINQQILARFRFLGRLMGQALLDEKTVPLPLAVEFFELLKEEERVVSINSPTTKKKKSKVPISRIIRLIESDDSYDGMGEQEESGIISTLISLGKKMEEPENRETATTKLEHLLEELGLRFVDPAQLRYSPSSNEQMFKEDNNVVVGEVCANQETEIFDNVPFADAPYPSVLSFAKEWSEKGKTKAQIERALENAGHSKIARWRVLQATQVNRATSTTEMMENRPGIQYSELIPDGRKLVVDSKNYREYLSLIEKHWGGNGIKPQIQATRLGLIDSLGKLGASTLLQWFSADALTRMFCGEQEVNWNDNEPLLGFLVPKGDYTSSSPEIRMLVDCLKKLTPAERSQFLSFCTALPRVPLSGLPQIKVYPPTKSRVTALVLNTTDRGKTIFYSVGEPTGEDSTGHRLVAGDRVRLAEGYEKVEDAANGPLKPGEIAEVTRVILRVKVKDWWYHPQALKRVREGEEEQVEEEEEEEEEEGEEEEEEAATEEAGAATDEGIASSALVVEDYTTPSSPSSNIISLDTSTSPTKPSNTNNNQLNEEAKRTWFEEGDVVKTPEATGIVSAWDASTNTLHLREAATNRNFRSGKKLTIVKLANDRQPTGPQAFGIKNVVEQCEIIQSPPLLRPKATTCVMTLYLPAGYENADHMLRIFREAFEDAKLGGLQDA